MMQLRTPEAFGGGAKIAKASAITAIEKFEHFTPATMYSPAWGEGQARELLVKITDGN